MRDLEVGDHILIENHDSVVVWQGKVARATGALVVVTDETQPPFELKTNAPVRVCFSEQRWMTKAHGRVVERENRGLKIRLSGHSQRVQRRGHVRVPLNQRAQVTVLSRDGETRVVEAAVVDVSQGGFQLRSDGPFTVADSVQVQCVLNGTSVQLVGHVVRAWRDAEGDVAGVRADALSPAAQSAVTRFVIDRSVAPSRADILSGRNRT